MFPTRPQREEFATNEESPEGFPLILIELNTAQHEKQSVEISVKNINDAGIGIVSETILHVGQIVRFFKDQLHWDLPSQGEVMWTFKGDSGYQAGIRFLRDT